MLNKESFMGVMDKKELVHARFEKKIKSELKSLYLENVRGAKGKGEEQLKADIKIKLAVLLESSFEEYLKDLGAENPDKFFKYDNKKERFEFKRASEDSKSAKRFLKDEREMRTQQIEKFFKSVEQYQELLNEELDIQAEELSKYILTNEPIQNVQKRLEDIEKGIKANVIKLAMVAAIVLAIATVAVGVALVASGAVPIAVSSGTLSTGAAFLMATFPKLKETVVKKLPDLLDTKAASFAGAMLETHVKKPIDDLYSLIQEMKECKGVQEGLEKFAKDSSYAIPEEQRKELDKFVKLSDEEKTLEMEVNDKTYKNLNALSELLKHRIERDISKHKTADKGISA